MTNYKTNIVCHSPQVSESGEQMRKDHTKSAQNIIKPKVKAKSIIPNLDHLIT